MYTCDHLNSDHLILVLSSMSMQGAPSMLVAKFLLSRSHANFRLPSENLESVNVFFPSLNSP